MGATEQQGFCSVHNETVRCIANVESGLNAVQQDMTDVKEFLGIGKPVVEAPPTSLVGQFLQLKYSIRNMVFAVCLVGFTLVGVSYYINRAPREEVRQEVRQLSAIIERVAESIKSITK